MREEERDFIRRSRSKSKSKKSSIELGSSPLENKDEKKSKEKFRFLAKNNFKTKSPIRIIPIELNKMRVCKDIYMKSNFNITLLFNSKF